jgi:hypothetical protein
MRRILYLLLLPALACGAQILADNTPSLDAGGDTDTGDGSPKAGGDTGDGSPKAGGDAATESADAGLGGDTSVDGGVPADVRQPPSDATVPETGSDASADAPSDSLSDDEPLEDASSNEDAPWWLDGGNNCGTGSVGPTCSPQPLSCVPSYVPSIYAPGACTPADAIFYYDHCLGACDDVHMDWEACQYCLANLGSECFHCLSNQQTGSPWGVVIYYAPSSFFSLNIAGCFAAIGASTACVTAQEEFSECTEAACAATCQSQPDASVGSACLSAAEQGECSTYAGAVTANCPSAILGASACAIAPSYQGYLTLAQTMCE